MRHAHLLFFAAALASSSCAYDPVDVRGLAATHATAADVEAIRLLLKNPPEGIDKDEWAPLKSIHFFRADVATILLDGGGDLEVRLTVRKKKGQWMVDKASISPQVFVTGQDLTMRWSERLAALVPHFR
jgi:hypothetical protein